MNTQTLSIRKPYLASSIATLAMLSLLTVANASDMTTIAQWSYSGKNGPANWAELNPDFQLCQTGNQQSPIDVGQPNSASLSKLSFDYKNNPLEVENSSRVIELEYEAGSNLRLGNEIYQLSQIQFHSPSEHTLSGQRYAMEAQLVHVNKNNQTLIVSVLMKAGATQNTVSKIMNAAPNDIAVNFVPGEQINAQDLLPSSTEEYFAYTGSLTSPPCNENVQWVVLNNVVEVSKTQVNKFLGIMHENARPVQARKNHKILISKTE